MSDSTSQLPPIRTFQFDTSAVASLDSNVNQFRGDINLTQALLAMPGRLSGDGLDISMSLLYQSNVYRDAMTWNRDAPTSIAGLGWTLPATLIELDDGGAPTPGTQQYTYVSGGIPTPLAREPETSNLFAVDASLANNLEDGQPVPAALRAEFLGRGFNLSSATTSSSLISRLPTPNSRSWTEARHISWSTTHSARSSTTHLMSDGSSSMKTVTECPSEGSAHRRHRVMQLQSVTASSGAYAGPSMAGRPRPYGKVRAT
ncbi:hypothetical protein [Rhizobium sp. LEGMi135b]